MIPSEKRALILRLFYRPTRLIARELQCNRVAVLRVIQKAVVSQPASCSSLPSGKATACEAAAKLERSVSAHAWRCW